MQRLFVDKMTPAPLSNAIRVHWISGKRLPESCGVLWLALLAGAIWSHTYFTTQAPIFDSFTYYMKAYDFWEAVRAGRWFDPLNIEPTMRPPGTILMSYPFGFDPDPRGFYFRSVYFPNCLLFLSVLISAYKMDDDIATRWTTILTAIFFTTMTLAYHFEYGDGSFGYWGLVDSFLTGLAALAAACVWRGARIEARVLAWAVAVSVVSATSILVKPVGTFVAAIAGIAWVAFGLAELARTDVSMNVALRLFVGAAVIGATDAAIVAAALGSHYLSRENLAYGQVAIAILKAEFGITLPILWLTVNSGLGGAFLLWGGLAVMACTWALFQYGSAAVTARRVVALACSLAALAFGLWFWFVISGGGTQIRYVTPFFVMAMIWLVPVVARASQFAPSLLKLSMSGVMIAAALNLVLVLLAPQPSVAWQTLAGVNVTATFPPETAASFRRLVAETPKRPANVYAASLDQNDAILSSIVSQTWLLRGGEPLSMQRPLDWVRPTTFRIAEIAAADVLLINPQQAQQAPVGSVVRNLTEEQGAFTAWADKLDASDGVSIFFSAPSTKILNIVEPLKFRESLERLIARYSWDPTFAEANHLSQP